LIELGIRSTPTGTQATCNTLQSRYTQYCLEILTALSETRAWGLGWIAKLRTNAVLIRQYNEGSQGTLPALPTTRQYSTSSSQKIMTC